MNYHHSDISTIADQIDTRWLRERRGFITGASGWFGSWFCQVLEYIGARSIKLWHTNDCNVDNFLFPNEPIDYIIHLAPGRVQRVIECAQHHDVESLLFTSSGAVYAEDIDEYGQMKCDNEWELINGEVPVKIARCFTFAGPGIPLYRGYALGNFIGQAINGESLHIWNDGLAIRTYMYITDLIVWLFKILIYGDIGTAYDVGAEQEVCIGALSHMVRGHFPEPKPCILIENRGVKERFPVYIPDISQSYDLGCRVTIGLDEAIKKTVEYYKGVYVI